MFKKIDLEKYEYVIDIDDVQIVEVAKKREELRDFFIKRGKEQEKIKKEMDKLVKDVEKKQKELKDIEVDAHLQNLETQYYKYKTRIMLNEKGFARDFPYGEQNIELRYVDGKAKLIMYKHGEQYNDSVKENEDKELEDAKKNIDKYERKIEEIKKVGWKAYKKVLMKDAEEKVAKFEELKKELNPSGK